MQINAGIRRHKQAYAGIRGYTQAYPACKSRAARDLTGDARDLHLTLRGGEKATQEEQGLPKEPRLKEGEEEGKRQEETAGTASSGPGSDDG